MNFLIAICTLNYIAIILMGYSRISFLTSTVQKSFKKTLNKQPFVSIHLAICNEPPEIVLETIKAILKNEYRNYEIVIISNNTNNTSSWKPIAKFSEGFKNIKFFHFDRIDGAKAGALNKALKLTNEKAEFIFVVDADYKLNKSALAIATSLIQRKEVELLQFPQGYRNISFKTKGLQTHYKHYFDCYLNSDKFKNSGLPTGTLSIIKRSVFERGFKWPTQTITEDAHLGVEMLDKKFSIGFCNLSIGRGLMPASVVDYSKQFKRWIFGNFQTLIILFGKNNFCLRNKIHLATMLTAWINLLAIPIITCIFLFPLLIINGDWNLAITLIILLSFISHVAIQFYIYYKISLKNFIIGLRALLIHLATIEVGSFYWLYYFINKEKPFHRTNKYLGTSELPINFIILPITCLLMSIYCFITGYIIIGIIGVIIFSISIISKLYLCFELYNSKSNIIQNNPT